jgi:hypothetical protein
MKEKLFEKILHEMSDDFGYYGIFQKSGHILSKTTEYTFLSKREAQLKASQLSRRSKKLFVVIPCSGDGERF